MNWRKKNILKAKLNIFQSSQPMTSRLNWQTTNNIASSSTNQDSDQRLHIDIYWRFTVHFTVIVASHAVVFRGVVLPSSPLVGRRVIRVPSKRLRGRLRLPKRQSMSPQTIPLRTTLTQMISHTLPIYDITPGFRPFTVNINIIRIEKGNLRWKCLYSVRSFVIYHYIKLVTILKHQFCTVTKWNKLI